MSQKVQSQVPQGKVCYGNCFSCSLQQAVYCASTHARVAMREAEGIYDAVKLLQEAVGVINSFKEQVGRVESLETEVQNLSNQIKKLQAILIGPNENLIDPLSAQEASGVDNRLPKQSN